MNMFYQMHLDSNLSQSHFKRLTYFPEHCLAIELAILKLADEPAQYNVACLWGYTIVREKNFFNCFPRKTRLLL